MKQTKIFLFITGILQVLLLAINIIFLTMQSPMTTDAATLFSVLSIVRVILAMVIIILSIITLIPLSKVPYNTPYRTLAFIGLFASFGGFIFGWVPFLNVILNVGIAGILLFCAFILKDADQTMYRF